jgi:hypothetical protein
VIDNAQLYGADLTTLTNEQPEKLFGWLISNECCPLDSFAPRWAVIQCTDTLVWGIYDSYGWKFASDIDPDIRPPKVETFIEARIFDENEEALIWQDAKGFHGRRLKSKDCAGELMPMDRIASFDENDDSQTSEKLSAGFIKRINPGGRILVTPPGKGLCIKEYLEEDDCGILRIAVTRFCGFLSDERE